ncbi:MAG: 4'-phosphopantetheinyl transferase superfamily protein [Oscillospiraceae bacterium]|jgi:phosphopantetheinyl transferase|nr:4'-phosphopantetheinyl transferase superfamily protein [Oscillospiraceae bacterium]
MKYYFYKCNETELEKQRASARCLFRKIAGADYIKDERGKPFIPDSNQHMSISHCRAGIAFIIAAEPVGIDVEEISRMDIKIARRICTQNEIKLLENTKNKQEMLCRFWVLKEAYSKLTGKGFAEKFNTIDTVKNKNLYAIRRGEVYIGIATSSSNFRPADSSPSLL